MTKDELDTRIAEKEAEIENLRSLTGKDFLEEAKEVVNKIQVGFPRGTAYLEKVTKQVKTRFAVNAWTGRKRTMYRVLTNRASWIAAAERRAKNAPIQGLSSEVSLSATYEMLKTYDKWKRVNRYNLKEFPLFTRVVHDASYFEIPYAEIIPFVWCYQYMATFGIAKMFNKEYKLPFDTPLEIEMEMSATEDKSNGWDWTLKNLREVIESTIDDLITVGNEPPERRQAVLDLVLAPARDPKIMASLQKNFPLLNVPVLPAEVIEQLTA